MPATPANTITPRREIKNYQVSGLINLTYVALRLDLDEEVDIDEHSPEQDRWSADFLGRL